MPDAPQTPSLTIAATGLDAAHELTYTLTEMGATPRGGHLKAETYPNTDITVGDVIRYLAGVDKAGNPSMLHTGPIRDIRPTEEDAESAARIFVSRVEEQLRALLRKKRQLITRNKLQTAKKMTAIKNANNAAAAGTRAAGKYIQEIMSDRVESNAYEPVSDTYAKQREEQYDVGRDEVLKASGLLLKNLQGGKFVMDRTGTLSFDI